jgi:protein DGCR14
MEESRQKFRLTHAWMFKDEQKSLEMKSEQLRLPSIEQQAGGESKEDQGRSKPVDGFTYKNVNSVFYTPDNVPLTPDEIVERAKKDRSIAFENTRFSSNPWRLELQNSTLKQTALYKREKEAGKVGVDGKEASAPASAKGLRGFNYVSMTPSPRPGVDDGESPLMTWGEVESTPYRLEGCETPLPISMVGAPGYSIQAVPRRDKLAYDLAEKNSKFYRDRKEKAIAKARSNIRTPSGMTERVAQMSPAAQRLATSKLGIRLGTDKALKAAYTPSRSRSVLRQTPTPTSSKTPSTATRTTAPATPKLQEAHFSSSLTDNLLDLSNVTSTSGLSLQQRRDRMTASDFL